MHDAAEFVKIVHVNFVDNSIVLKQTSIAEACSRTMKRAENRTETIRQAFEKFVPDQAGSTQNQNSFTQWSTLVLSRCVAF